VLTPRAWSNARIGIFKLSWQVHVGTNLPNQKRKAFAATGSLKIVIRHITERPSGDELCMSQAKGPVKLQRFTDWPK
jgi:hypothetical protein